MSHPVSMCVPVNHTVTLSLRAEGTGLLQYQWFTDEDDIVCEVCGVSACASIVFTSLASIILPMCARNVNQ